MRFEHCASRDVGRGRHAEPTFWLRMVALLLGVGLLASCIPGERARERDRAAELEAARQAFVDFDFIQARDRFASLMAADPDDVEAAKGLARSLATLVQFEEALEAHEAALRLDPDDPRLHEGLLYTLVWGGRLRGRRDWLDRALESGGNTLRRFPESATSYGLVQDAAGELNQADLWLRILESLEPAIGESPVYRVHRYAARHAAARAAGDTEAVASIEQELRQALEKAAAAEEQTAGSPPSAARRYLLAQGTSLLRDRERAREWIGRLDETEDGRRLGVQLAHFQQHYMAWMAAREAPAEEQMATLRSWQDRFPPGWDQDFTYRQVPLTFEFELLRSQAHERRDAGEEIDASTLDRMEEIGRKLVRLDTWGGAGTAANVTTALLELDARLEVALAIADDTIAGLEADRAGLIYPGTVGPERERARENALAGLHRVRGLTLAALDDDAAAEESLHAAVELMPRSDRLAALGEFLAERGRDDEGYGLLVRALAHNEDDERIANRVQGIRAAALAAGEATGGTEETLLADLEAARGEAIEQARDRILADRLDRPAPDFELTGLDGKEWRLADLAGKVVVLNFWATWCGPCRTEMPHYQELVNEYAAGDDVVFLAITTDGDPAVTRSFLGDNGYEFPTLLDDGTSTDYQVTGVPSHFVIDPGGRLQYVSEGFTNPERYAREMRWRIEALRRTGS